MQTQKFSDFISSVAVRVSQGLGFKPTESKQLKNWQLSFEQQQRDNHDRWEALKQDIHRIESQILKRKAEYDSAHGMVREMVGEEIKLLFADLDRKQAQIKILRRNIDALSVTLDKIRELEQAAAKCVGEDQLDAIAVRLEEALDEVKQADAALEGIEQIQYEGPGRAAMDIKKRTEELKESGEKPTGLSESVQERLNQLQKDLEG